MHGFHHNKANEFYLKLILSITKISSAALLDTLKINKDKLFSKILTIYSLFYVKLTEKIEIYWKSKHLQEKIKGLTFFLFVF